MNPKDQQIDWDSYIDGNIIVIQIATFTWIVIVLNRTTLSNHLYLQIWYPIIHQFTSFLERMVTKFVGFDGLNGIKSTLQNLTDTSLYFYDMQDFQRRLKSKPIHPITKRPQGSGLVEAASFLVEIEALEWFMNA